MADNNLSKTILKDIYSSSFDSALESIRKGLKADLYDSDLYYYMGLVYMNKNNYNCSYLCFENALQYADNEDSIRKIKDAAKLLTSNNEVNINDFSVIILTHNHLHSTIQCIEHLKRNNPLNNYEIIFVDNGSTDDTPLWIQSQMGIKYILNPVDNGFSASCNQGIRIAKRDNDILVLSSDAITMPNSIFNLRMALYSSSKNGTASSVRNEKIEFNSNDTFYFSSNEIDTYYAYALKNNVPDNSRHECMLTSETYSLFIKRDVINEVGLFNEDFTPCFYENYDFCLRTLKKGYNNIYCKDSFVFYYGFSKDENADSECTKLKNDSNLLTHIYGIRSL